MNPINKRTILLSLICLLIGRTGYTQNCNCTISEVENNTVTPCTLIIGVIDTVTTVNELKSAISQANNLGGNRTILIADGTYQVASTSSYPYITASNVVFRSLSGNRDNVILTGAGMTDVAPLVENGFYIVGNNVTISVRICGILVDTHVNHPVTCERHRVPHDDIPTRPAEKGNGVASVVRFRSNALNATVLDPIVA